MIEHSKASVVFHSIKSVCLFHLLSISQDSLKPFKITEFCYAFAAQNSVISVILIRNKIVQTKNTKNNSYNSIQLYFYILMYANYFKMYNNILKSKHVWQIYPSALSKVSHDMVKCTNVVLVNKCFKEALIYFMHSSPIY